MNLHFLHMKLLQHPNLKNRLLQKPFLIFPERVWSSSSLEEFQELKELIQEKFVKFVDLYNKHRNDKFVDNAKDVFLKNISTLNPKNLLEDKPLFVPNITIFTEEEEPKP